MPSFSVTVIKISEPEAEVPRWLVKMVQDGRQVLHVEYDGKRSDVSKGVFGFVIPAEYREVLRAICGDAIVNIEIAERTLGG